MVGRFQPHIYYDAPQGDSGFNPKSVTMASRLPPPAPKKKQDGPLIDFNRHPDSYLILPYGNRDVKPMGKRTKAYIKIVRWVQLALRVFTLLGAVGVLLCGIFIRGAADTEGYIMRIPPGVDLVVCLYAIYHLIRNAKSRPPASSASYHFFALVTDAGFIPFYVFTILMSRRNSDMDAATIGRWRTMFPTDEETNKVLTTTWLTSTAVAGLHLVSLFLDFYLLIIFRKITKMPADMNPLEDNLTKRNKAKHKYKDSNISAVTPLTGDNEKRFSVQSTVAGDRFSQADPLLSKDIPNPNQNQIAFMHTRRDSEMTYSPHNPHTARESKERFSMYSQPPSAHQSRRELNHRDDLHRRDDVDDNETLAQRKSMLSQQANIKRHSRNDSYAANSSKDSFYTPPTTARSDKPEVTGDLSLQRNSRETLQNDNWFVHQDEEEEEAEQEEHYPAPPPPARKQSVFSGNNTTSNQGYNTLSPYDDVSDYEDDHQASQPMVPQPLRMNPPTPPPTQVFDQKKYTPPPTTLKRTQTTTSISTDATFNRSHSHSRSGTPKSRYYGDLKAATQGIKDRASPANSPHTAPTKSSFRNTPNHFPSATKQYISNTPPPSSHSPVKNSPFTLDKKSYTSVRRTGETAQQPVQGRSPRVVSRSGVDYMNPYEYEEADLGTSVMGRRRDASGKIAEEGRGGMTFRRVSGMA